MAAQVQLQEDRSIDLERNLAEDIARAMQNRPLMSRLARIEAAYTDEVPGVPAVAYQRGDAAAADPGERQPAADASPAERQRAADRAAHGGVGRLSRHCQARPNGSARRGASIAHARLRNVAALVRDALHRRHHPRAGHADHAAPEPPDDRLTAGSPCRGSRPGARACRLWR